MNRQNLDEFSRNIQLSFHSSYRSLLEQSSSLIQNSDDDLIIKDNSVYLLQTILADGETYTIFYDSGCSDMVCKYEAIQRLGKRAIKEPSGPSTLGGVGDTLTHSEHGLYTIRLPLFNGKNAVLTGVCLSKNHSILPRIYNMTLMKNMFV